MQSLAQTGAAVTNLVHSITSLTCLTVDLFCLPLWKPFSFRIHLPSWALANLLQWTYQYRLCYLCHYKTQDWLIDIYIAPCVATRERIRRKNGALLSLIPDSVILSCMVCPWWAYSSHSTVKCNVVICCLLSGDNITWMIRLTCVAVYPVSSSVCYLLLSIYKQFHQRAPRFSAVDIVIVIVVIIIVYTNRDDTG